MEKKILLIDDDQDLKDSLKVFLEVKGYKVDMASDKVEGFEKIRSFNPDLIILDVQMTTHFEGFEMKKEIKASDEFKHLPVLMLTGIEITETANPQVRDLAREMRQNPNFNELEVILLRNSSNNSAGIDYKPKVGQSLWLPVDGFLSKPVESEVLYKEVARLLK